MCARDHNVAYSSCSPWPTLPFQAYGIPLEVKKGCFVRRACRMSPPARPVSILICAWDSISTPTLEMVAQSADWRSRCTLWLDLAEAFSFPPRSPSVKPSMWQSLLPDPSRIVFCWLVAWRCVRKCMRKGAAGNGCMILY